MSKLDKSITLNILFGLPRFVEWSNNLIKIKHNIYFDEIDNLEIILKTVKKYNIDILIPCTFKQMYFTIDNYVILSKTIKYIVCGKDKKPIRLLNDKHMFCEYMIRRNFSKFIPTLYFSNINSIGTLHDKISYPCIFKLIKTCGGDGSFIIKTNVDLNNTLNKTNYIIQEYINSPNEYAGHFCTINGKIIYYVFYKITNNDETFIQRGKVQMYERITKPIHLDVFSKIFMDLNYTGFACIDFRIFNNSPKIFEINPRLGGSLVSNNNDLTDAIITITQKYK